MRSIFNRCSWSSDELQGPPLTLSVLSGQPRTCNMKVQKLDRRLKGMPGVCRCVLVIWGIQNFSVLISLSEKCSCCHWLLPSHVCVERVRAWMFRLCKLGHINVHLYCRKAPDAERLFKITFLPVGQVCYLLLHPHPPSQCSAFSQ